MEVHCPMPYTAVSGKTKTKALTLLTIQCCLHINQQHDTKTKNIYLQQIHYYMKLTDTKPALSLFWMYLLRVCLCLQRAFKWWSST